MAPASEGLRGLRPGPPLEGVLRAPGSKSLAQRALLAALFARGRSRLSGLPDGDDVRAARGLTGAGDGAEVELQGRGAGALEGAAFDVGEAGTLARLSLGALALAGRPGARFELRARGSLLRRGAPALRDALARAGVSFAGDGWPWRFAGVEPPPRLRLVRPESSQELSALLLGLAAHEGERTIEVEGLLPSRPYAEMTCGVLRRFGAQITVQDRPDGSRWTLRGPLHAPGEPLEIEPDASSAAVALAAGALSGGAVTAEGLARDSLQGDVRIAEHLAAFGCRAHFGAAGLEVCGAPTRPARIDLRGEPDLAPVLAVVAAAAAAGGRHADPWSELGGLATLEGKESPRLSLLAHGLCEAGWAVEAGADVLRIGARRADAGDGAVELDAHGDHRMAFAFALLGLLRPGVRVRAGASVSKSWPGFWEDLARLGARPAR